MANKKKKRKKQTFPEIQQVPDLSKGAGIWCKGRCPVNCKKCKCYNVYGNQKKEAFNFIYCVHFNADMLICVDY